MHQLDRQLVQVTIVGTCDVGYLGIRSMHFPDYDYV